MTVPYSKCPECHCVFHLQIREDPKTWYEKQAPGIPVGEVVNLLCFGCWKPLKEYDVVEVIRSPEGKPHIQRGDIGAVLMVVADKNGKQAYEVECVTGNGQSLWIETLERNYIKYDMKRNKKTEPSAGPYGSPAAGSPSGQP